MQRKLIIIILLACLGLGLFIHYQFRAPKRDFSDFRVYYNAGKDILSGKNIYVRYSEEITPFKYSPVFAVFMSAFAVFDKRIAASLFFLVNLACLFFSFSLSRKLIFFQNLPPKKEFLIFILVFIFSFRVILHCLDSGQVGLLILFLILSGLFLITKGKEISGSLLIIFSGMIKYMPFLFVFYFLLKKKYKIVLVMVLLFLFYCLLPAIFVGLKTNFIYLKEWLPYITSTSLDQRVFLDSKNHSLWAFPRRIFPFINNFTATLITLSLFIILVAFFSFRKKQKNNKVSQFTTSVDYGMVFLCLALFNPNAWLHNFTVIIFPCMVAVYYLFVCNFKDKFILFLMILSTILFSVGSESLVGDRMQWVLEYYSTVTLGTLFLFIALVKIKFFSKFTINEEV